MDADGGPKQADRVAGGKRSGDAPPTVASLDPTQRARRDRLVAAAIGMMLHTECDRIQMKDVTAAAGVAMRTTYRYFASKDHLLAESLLTWSQRFPTPPPDVGGRSVDQLKRAYRLAVRAFESHPTVYRTIVALQASADPFAAARYQEFADGQVAAFENYLVGVDAPRRTMIVAVMNAVLDGSLRQWAFGRMSIDEVYRSIEDASELILGS